MGGNVVVVDVNGLNQRPDKPDFRILDRDRFVNDFLLLFEQIDSAYHDHVGLNLWPKGVRSDLFSTCAVFNGSSSHLFDYGISSEEFVRYKPKIGDLDITVPDNNLRALSEVLSSMQGKKITEKHSFLGQKPSLTNGQINSVFEYELNELNKLKVQIDFEGTPYDANGPLEFIKFSKSSNWFDVKAGVKGVFHKLLLRSIATVVSSRHDAVLLTPQSPLEPFEKIRLAKSDHVHTLSFSVDKGLRVAAEQQFYRDCTPVMVSGKFAYKKTEARDSIFVRSKFDIFEMLVSRVPTKDDMNLFSSFLGLLTLLNSFFEEKVICDIYLDFVDHKLFGQKSQVLDIFDESNDYSTKMPAVNMFRNELQFLKVYDHHVEKMIASYYNRKLNA